MLRVARAALFVAAPAELVVLVLAASGVPVPGPVVAVVKAVVAAMLLLQVVAAGRLVVEARRDGADWPAALRSVRLLVPERLRRIVAFDAKGMVSLVLLVARRRHGVPQGAVGVPYAGAQLGLQAGFLFAMVVEVVGVELLLRAVDAPEGLRAAFLVIDLYSILIVLAVIAACVTRPHVLSDDELRVRYGAFFDLRIPRAQISSLRVVRNYNESGMVKVLDDRLAVAVASQTNVVVELREPIRVVRPLGGRADVRTVRFFADDPSMLVEARPAVPGQVGG
ncbi:hypothetical protein HUT06_30565 [Actinomadura sp. NAK00032]|uniref:hypothetical protein n=1 Tax=Actinomadura sp. NAK00032 TaxID=2742128 RepID=UPI0015909AFC|nr:hypothetical protein [Actinomadura sp. NAK00032]QKW37816.1 hypothetical protein HUT06_30565 [Actinomadura sp. NAK00032]